jgi:glycosyltransferase involved in cell wall biosynthesis
MRVRRSDEIITTNHSDVWRIVVAASQGTGPVDAFVFPSHYEACSLAIFEALASGLPVMTTVTAGGPGGAEVIGEGGIVITDPDDIQQLSKSMEYLAKAIKTLSIMAEKAREVATKLSWLNVTERYLELYDRCL